MFLKTVLESLLNKVADLQACKLYSKETPKLVFFCEICETFKNTLFTDTSGDWFCSEKFGKILWKTPMKEFCLNNIAGQAQQLYSRKNKFAMIKNFAKCFREVFRRRVPSDSIDSRENQDDEHNKIYLWQC